MSDKFFVKESKYVTHSVTQAPSSGNVVSQGSGGQPSVQALPQPDQQPNSQVNSQPSQQPNSQPPVAHVSYSQGNPAQGTGNYAEALDENHFVGRENQLGPLPSNSKNPLKSDSPVKSVVSIIFTVVVVLIALGIFTRIIGVADSMNRLEDPINRINQFDRQFGTDLPSDWPSDLPSDWQETIIYDDYDDSYSPSEWDDFDVEYLVPGTDFGF